jgi:phosphatidylglycerophosphate synthase
MERPANKSWFRWNLANILSLTRLLGPFAFFCPWLSFFEKVAVYAILTSTDCVDGWLAKKIGNFDGIGKMIDMIPDKILHISFFLFLLLSGKLDYFSLIVMALVVIQESRIAFLLIEAVNLVFEKELREKASLSRRARLLSAHRKVKQEIIEKVYANEFGRWKMVAYSIGGYFYLSFIVIEKMLLYWYALLFFVVGICLSFLAYRKYNFDFEKWKHDFLDQT